MTPDPQKAKLEALLLTKCAGHSGLPIPLFDRAAAEKLLFRIDGIRLFAHSFSFYQGLAHGTLQIDEILRFAADQGLHGASINIDIGGTKALSRMSNTALGRLRSLADELELAISLEMSSTEFDHFQRAQQIAAELGARWIRMRSAKVGRAGDVVRDSIADLKRIAVAAERRDHCVGFEQHEALKSCEIVEIVTAVDSGNVRILFDFGNMINVGEEPLEALQIQAPLVRLAHLKGVRKVPGAGGCGQLGVPEGEDDLPQAKLMFDLLMLGDYAPQVPIFILEKVVGYASPPMRQPDDGPDTEIRHRAPSTLPLSADGIENDVRRERQHSVQQVQYVKSMLKTLREPAKCVLAADG